MPKAMKLEAKLKKKKAKRAHNLQPLPSFHWFIMFLHTADKVQRKKFAMKTELQTVHLRSFTFLPPHLPCCAGWPHFTKFIFK